MSAVENYDENFANYLNAEIEARGVNDGYAATLGLVSWMLKQALFRLADNHDRAYAEMLATDLTIHPLLPTED